MIKYIHKPHTTLQDDVTMIPILMQPQPNDETCGPTSLHAVYSYYGDKISLEQVVKEVTYLEDGGTLAVLLGCHALNRGYKASIYTYNLHVFDLSWFEPGIDLRTKLTQQMAVKSNPKIQKASKAYIEFLSLGGKISCENLTVQLLERYFKRQVPILSGLSATYLYDSARETYTNGKTALDDINGLPSGHFVVLCGHNDKKQNIVIADPYCKNPYSQSLTYEVAATRVINSIMLGILTYDANILIIEKI